MKIFDQGKFISKPDFCINNLCLLLGKDAGALLLYGGFDNDSNALGDCWKLDLDKGKILPITIQFRYFEDQMPRDLV